MTTTISIQILTTKDDDEGYRATTMLVRIDRISAMIPDKCTKDDKGTVIIDGFQVNVYKNYNNAFRAFCEHNRLRSIAPFN